jgi:hypothetical protein
MVGPQVRTGSAHAMNREKRQARIVHVLLVEILRAAGGAALRMTPLVSAGVVGFDLDFRRC